MLIGLCLFATAASGGAVASVASISMAILFITSLFYIQRWSELWRALSHNEKLLLVGLALYSFSGLISYFNANDGYEYVKHMGRYLRFLFIIPVYLLLTRGDMQLFRYLLAGAIVSGPLYLMIALSSISERPGYPASGHYHWITFGDAAMLSVVFLAATLIIKKTGFVLKAIIACAIACAFYASLLSQARGAWLALLLCLAVMLYMMFKSGNVKIKLKVILPLLALVIAITGASSINDLIQSRVQEAVVEIELFVSGEKVDTSVGGRLAMWDIAIDVWQEHPIIGTGLGDFDQEIELRQSQGVYESIAVHASVHNIFLQALATTGTVGFLILFFSLIFQPIRIFYQSSREKLTSANTAGLVVIVAYAVFGLTESWILRAPVVSMYLLYLITLSVTVSRE